MTQQQLSATRFERDASDEATLEALANERRRAILDEIDEDDAPVALADLARDVAVREADAPLTALSDGYIATVKRSLYHAHLPKLDDLGLVAFDADERTVERATSTAGDREPTVIEAATGSQIDVVTPPVNIPVGRR